MPVKLVFFDETSLVHGFSIEVTDKKLLASYVSTLLLGYQDHIEQIIQSIENNRPYIPNRNIESLIQKINDKVEITKRDGWLFQMISWIAVQIAFKEKRIYSQIPHDAPAQHGIDGILVILNNDGVLESIVITEDKASENPRQIIKQQVFPEFIEFESGEHDHKLVNRVTGLLKNNVPNNLMKEIQEDIYRIELRIYRIGITHDTSYRESGGYFRLFKDYDKVVVDDHHGRRSAATLTTSNLREWMDDFASLVICDLESRKNV